ncbi:MAG: PaaI family thioesterase [Leptospiraceae bacterium]|nr:PaaI family thioesterase [Leptospiraceae bacterium]
MSLPKRNEESEEMFHKEMRALRIPEGIGIQIPPPSFGWLRGEFWSYTSRKELSVRFPVFEEELNPLGNMQGGVIAAAFDNTFGPLSFLCAKGPAVTLDMNQQYVRGIRSGDYLYITAKLVNYSPYSMYMTAEACNSKGKPVASAGTNSLILKRV